MNQLANQDIDFAVAEVHANQHRYSAEELVEVLENLQRKHSTLTAALQEKKRVTRETKDECDAAEAAHQAAIEEPIPISSTIDTHVTKLRHVERTWQEWKDVRDGANIKRAEARRTAAAAEESLNEAIQSTRQMTLVYE